MEAINLDAYRASRREANKQAPKVRFGGKTYTLPVEAPLELLEVLDAFDPEMSGGKLASSVLSVCRVLLGHEQYETFKANKPSLEDAMAFLNGFDIDGKHHGGVLAAYGFGSPGESEAPPESSSSISGPVKLTSSGTTA